MTRSPAAGAPGPAAGLPVFAEVPGGRLPVPFPGGAGAGHTEGFGLTVVPVTAGQYWRSLTDRGLRAAPAPRLHGFPAEPGTGLRRTPAGAVVPDGDPDLPATWVTWHGARAYCAWLGARSGRFCRLPSAAEWQYAAAGPDGLRWALGDAFDRAVYAPPASGPRPAGATAANGFGLRDMTGNVFEWCADALPAPGFPDGTVPGSRVVKGGAYTVRNPESFENAAVFTADELSTVPYIGFRVLCEAAGPGPEKRRRGAGGAHDCGRARPFA
ncbi:SUMF1/EgtB/PvdO family nonheme iron enzyme [Streptomyces sp. F63]|uniref:formylglycine-generating enzyme family protein n=1 Tax=Streptomyces sp. F63 TaxID=2824887 RepID=UPI001B37ED75|nr:SUMF1/EgtB/PvdO family nonheme iron enzyme [Streptomyces sp. F63]MBQ0984722.1 SUMF1/EgtB/PvdO family nonheme iron enzyme [Streptomyces sp. F63]